MFHTYLKLANQIPALVLILMSGASVVAGDFFAKSWSVHRGGWLFLGAVVAYALSGVFYTPALLREGLVVSSVLWSSISVVGFLIIGLIIFSESLSVLQWAGVGFGITALIILSIASA